MRAQEEEEEEEEEGEEEAEGEGAPLDTRSPTVVEEVVVATLGERGDRLRDLCRAELGGRTFDAVYAYLRDCAADDGYVCHSTMLCYVMLCCLPRSNLSACTDAHGLLRCGVRPCCSAAGLLVAGSRRTILPASTRDGVT
jgi:hypothetical protein